MNNPILILSAAMMALGAVVAFGVFDRIGPVTSQKGMSRLGIALVVLGVAVGLTQSEPRYPDEIEQQADR